MQVIPIKTTIVTPGTELMSFITSHIGTLTEQSILVITSKIVAIAEGRIRPCTTKEDRMALIKAESDMAIETPWTWLTVKDGQVYASAGIDESNVGEGNCVLLPEDSYESARVIREALKAHYGVTDLGVLITDSRVLPLRQGAVGIALGYAGFEGIKDYRGQHDLYKRPFKVSRANIADSLATTAVLCMGEGSECQPLAVITEAPVTFTDRAIQKEELQIPVEDDMYLPFFKDLDIN